MALTIGEALDEFGGWTVIRSLGSGGQGAVSLSAELAKALRKIEKAIHQGGGVGNVDRPALAKGLADATAAYARPDRLNELGAAKRYNIPAGAEGDRGASRLKKEIDVLSKVSSRGLLRLLDSNIEQRWTVTEYHPDGHLGERPERFRGKPFDALIKLSIYGTFRARKNQAAQGRRKCHRAVPVRRRRSAAESCISRS